jgi:hypothetical protein
MAAPAGNFQPETSGWNRNTWDNTNKVAVANGINVDADTHMTPPLNAAAWGTLCDTTPASGDRRLA